MEGLCCLMGSRSKYHRADRNTEEDRMCIGIKQACERTIKTQGSNYQSCPTMTRHDFKNTKTCSRGAMYHQSCLRRTLSRRRNFATSISLLFYTHSILNLIILPAILLFLNTTGGSFSTVRVVNACHPGGRYGGGRHIPRKIVPMVCGQHIPNVSEKTIGASGPAEGKITRDSKRYREELKSNWNPNIFFRDEEGTMADHMMTERCRDFLNRLAIMVAERWKNKVILRVVEAWDEDGAHEPNSLHYEGRAVDITTNDTDRSKYGILARLAVEAGFDWVYYQSRSHVHCSVKSDKSDAARYGGCFSGDSLAYRPDGSTVLMSQLLPGDSVLSVDSAGNIVDDEVLSFMDRIPSRNIQTAMKFIRITTDKGNSLTLTSNHLVYAIVTNDIHIPYLHIDTGQDMRNLADFVYAHLVKVGDYVFETQNALNTTEKRNKITKPSRVIAVTSVSSSEGAYAPLTGQGTILVNGVTASCYAVFDSHNIAHLAMGPMRLYNRVVNLWVTPKMEINNDVPWYPRFLYELGSAFFSEHMLPS